MANKAPKKTGIPDLRRKQRDRTILLSAAAMVTLLFVLGLLAPSLISMKSTAAVVFGFFLLAASLACIALIIDRLILRFWS
jgi:hypothetical protein